MRQSAEESSLTYTSIFSPAHNSTVWSDRSSGRLDRQHFGLPTSGLTAGGGRSDRLISDRFSEFSKNKHFNKPSLSLSIVTLKLEVYPRDIHSILRLDPRGDVVVSRHLVPDSPDAECLMMARRKPKSRRGRPRQAGSAIDR